MEVHGVRWHDECDAEMQFLNPYKAMQSDTSNYE